RTATTEITRLSLHDALPISGVSDHAVFVCVALQCRDRWKTDQVRTRRNLHSDRRGNCDARPRVRARAKSDDDRVWSAKFFRYSGEILKKDSGILSIVRPLPREIG